jgi:DNA polymerase III delta' subunit
LVSDTEIAMTEPDHNDRIERALANACTKNRVPHAMAFIGDKGVGREATARRLAAGLLCVDEHHADLLPFGCTTCSACKRVQSGSHPDVHLVASEQERLRRGLFEQQGEKRPAAQIGVDEIRTLSRTMRMKPFEGRVRVAIIVDAHLMTINAANALLKTLEEPEPGAFLLLIAPHERTLLPTIASRCMRLRFPPAAHVADTQSVDFVPELGRFLTGPLHRRVDAIESLGKDRSDAESWLKELTAELVKRVSTRARSNDGDVAADDPWNSLELLPEIARAQRSIGRNANVQLTMEELLLLFGAKEPTQK